MKIKIFIEVINTKDNHLYLNKITERLQATKLPLVDQASFLTCTQSSWLHNGSGNTKRVTMGTSIFFMKKNIPNLFDSKKKNFFYVASAD